MLVLARKRNELIQIGDDIILKVVEIGARSVKIGIEAPDDVRVIRSELFGKPGPRHPLSLFLRQRRAEKIAGALNSVRSTAGGKQPEQFDTATN